MAGKKASLVVGNSDGSTWTAVRDIATREMQCRGTKAVLRNARADHGSAPVLIVVEVAGEEKESNSRMKGFIYLPDDDDVSPWRRSTFFDELECSSERTKEVVLSRMEREGGIGAGAQGECWERDGCEREEGMARSRKRDERQDLRSSSMGRRHGGSISILYQPV